jgi:hypothetical protein
MLALRPCAACQRHVKAGELACPFCARDMPSEVRATRASPSRPLSRAALLLSASVLGGCAADLAGEEIASTDASADADEAADPDAGTMVPHYGAPPSCDAGLGTGAPAGAVLLSGTAALLAAWRRRQRR